MCAMTDETTNGHPAKKAGWPFHGLPHLDSNQTLMLWLLLWLRLQVFQREDALKSVEG